MKTRTLIIALLIGISSTAFARPDHPAEQQLVTVRVTYQNWNEYRPWQKAKPGSRRFFGIVVPGNRILVLAQHLDDATLIQVEKFDRPPRVPARIVHSDPQANLALITVDDPSFFEDLVPADIADIMEGDNYYCASWKSGQLTTASCRWSRVVVRSSFVPHLSYAGIYFITDLKSGGRGEPVFSGNKLVGLIRSQDNDQIIVFPAEMIQAYLKAVDLPEYPGFAQLSVGWQVNRGRAQAEYLGLDGPARGIRIRNCIAGGSADGILQPDDLLLELDGHPIDSQGDYMHPRYGWLDYKLIAAEGHYAGDIIAARVLRNGKEITLDIPLKNIPESSALIPKTRTGQPPPYLIAGGLVFRELDTPYLRAWGNEWMKNIPARLRIYTEMESENHSPDKRLIVLADVFPDEYNLGYHDMSQNIVTAVNGRPINSIADMEEAFKHPEGEFHVIEFVPTYGLSKVILDAKEFSAATTRIMETYQIPSRIRLRKKTEQ
ncbi:MAG: hypothetical protein KAU94_02820 [Verrucomicrobia bacterium]|nr:hypothetical protein [Verrucomicrobiota bacterium]